MPPRTLLIFDLDDARFGVEAALVRETVRLPELTPAEEAPPYIAGLFSLRGRIVPVTDLNLRFGRPSPPYCLSDQVVVLELDRRPMGLIVSAAIEVVEVPAEAVSPPPKFDVEVPAHAGLVEGEAKVGDVIVTLLDARRLAHPPQEIAPAAADRPARRFCPQAAPEEHAVYRARAKALMEIETAEEGERLPLAVVELGGECFGLELEAVREFCVIARPCPIPCCPPHVLGAVSLRGDLLVLLDPRAALDLPRATQECGKAVVALLGEQAVGLAVDQVHDVIYLRKEELSPPPAALRERHGSEVKGTAHYGGKTMAVLDLPALLAREDWIVNETA